MHSWSTSPALLGAALLAASASGADLPILAAGRLHDVRIVMDEYDWQALRDNFRTNQYYAADVWLDGELMAQAGVRSRGESSRSGEKPGLKLDFNRHVPGQEYHGTKTLVLDNLVTDASMLREHLALQVFEAMGIAAPRTAFARLSVNDTPWGLYAVVEPVNKPFLMARLGEDDGNLYDYEWAFEYRFADLGDPWRYVPVPFQPQTHEDAPDPSGLAAFVHAVSTAPDETFLAELGAFVDPAQVITYLAVENALAERDGLLGLQGMNNFYLYESVRTGRFTLIPWDKDSSFTSGSWSVDQGVAENVLARRLLEQPGARAAYEAAVARCVRDHVNAAWLVPRLAAAYALIRSEAWSDPRKPYSGEEFEAAVSGLHDVVAARAADVDGQIGR